MLPQCVTIFGWEEDKKMEALHELGLALIRLFQENYPQLEGIFRFISALGQEEFYLLVMPLVYWCISKPFGKQVGYLFLMSIGVNAIAKQAFRSPRPYWIDPAVGVVEQEGYGMPSNHAQNAAALYPFVAAWARRRWVWVLAIIGVLLVGASRIYLGVHFPTDVAGGLFLGLVLLLLAAGWWWYFAGQFSKRILGQKLLVAVMVPLVVAVLYVIVRLIIGEAELDVPWTGHIPEAERESVDAIATAVGALWGFGVGVALEASRVRFRTEGALWLRALRFVLGIAVTVALWAGLDTLFPDDPLWLAVPLRIIRYLLVTLWVAYYGPMLFVRLRLAPADPAPEISMKL
jgi:membrane-associated phospholipid phosphatase